MLVVDASIFASFAFAYIHVSMRLTVCPPPGATLPRWRRRWLLRLAGARVRAGAGWPDARSASAACPGWCWRRWPARWRVRARPARLWRAGLDPDRQRLGAAIAALASYQGLHIVLLAVLGPYLALRAWRGHLGPRSRATLDNIALVWHYTTLQGIAAVAVVRLMPLLME
jgi:cytochrome c oxidase subunit I+III